jgi:hypothetical protein
MAAACLPSSETDMKYVRDKIVILMSAYTVRFCPYRVLPLSDRAEGLAA